MNFRLGKHEVTTHKTLIYLGIMVDQRRMFAIYAYDSCERAKKALSGLKPNGPSAKKIRVLAHTVGAMMLYEPQALSKYSMGQIWGGTLRIKREQERLDFLLRSMALRVASAYVTVSGEGVIVIASLVSVRLAVQERRERAGLRVVKYADGMRDRRRTIQKWQVAWSRETGVAARTKRMVKDVAVWFYRRWGQVNFQITQFLTGHGSFGTYL